MLNLIEGGFFAGGKEMITELAANRTRRNEKSLFIVPEPQTVKTEREMANILPSSAPLCFEVTNFTRLADTVFRSLGGLSISNADSAKRALLMWRTLTELSPILETFGKGKEISSGNVTRMLATVEQIQSAALDAHLLSEAADRMMSEDVFFDARLHSKLKDISAVISLYKKLLFEKFSESNDVLISAAKKLSNAPSEFLSDTEIFIEGFTSFTEPQYNIIDELLKKCTVTINLIIPKEHPDAFEYSEVKNAHGRLAKLAAKNGIDVKLERLGGIHTETDPLICETVNLIWRSLGKIDDDIASKESIKIFEATDPYEECDFIASDIKRRVMEGSEYSDFGIIARSLSPYESLLNISFDKAGIPLFMSTRTDIGTYEVIKLIYSAFSVIGGGFERRDVISYSKCSLSGVDDGLADEFELYAEKWQIQRNRFKDGIIWNMNPDGYTDRRTEQTVTKLLLIHEAKEAIISPLLTLEESLEDACTVKDYTVALVNFLTKLDIEEKLKKKSRESKVLLNSNAAEEIGRLWKLICDALDSLCEVLGDLKTDARTYLNLLKITFEKTDIGRIPAYADSVAAADAEGTVMSGKKHIYIIGTNAGEFPGISDDDSYFTQSDKRILSSLGVSIDENTDIQSSRELYLFVKALSYAKKTVTITLHSADTSFKTTPKSEAVNKISEISSGKIKIKKISDIPTKDLSYFPEYALEHISNSKDHFKTLEAALSLTEFKERLDISSKNIHNSKLKLSSSSIMSLYDGKIRMTQSKLEKYVKCPMNYFCTYNLDLNPEKRVEFDARNIGNFIHSVLENFFILLKKEGKKISMTTDEERLKLISRVATDYVVRCFEGIPKTSVRIKNTIDKICRASKPIIDSLCDEFSNCKYEPTFFEVEIKEEKNTSASKLKTSSGAEISLSGKIDRVDVYKEGNNAYIRVIDYKSGNKIFSPSDIEEGLNLQMFLYLKSIVGTKNKDLKEKMGADENTKLIPAGVIYLKTDISEPTVTHNSEEATLSAVKNNQKRTGMILNDSESISAMNPNFLPIKFKKDGTPDSHSKDKLYTSDGWDKISDTIDRALTNICEKVISGEIPANIFMKKGEKSPCLYCDFKAICRSAKF